jgi:hypothetical protein
MRRVTGPDSGDQGVAQGGVAKVADRFVDNSAGTRKKITIWVGGAVLVALVATIAFAYQAENPSVVIAIATIIGAAAAFTGALFGFIFGVPRVRSSDQPPDEKSSPGGSTRIGANTNLEQISDWLTKILVGVGLTQFVPITQAAGRLFESLAPSFGGSTETGTAFAGGLIIYMATCGFATAWLFTRLFLGGAMVTADLATAVDIVRDSLDKADVADRAGDETAARAYRSQARGALETIEGGSVSPQI